MKNQVQLIGNLGIDPEVTNFESGAKKVGFTLATNEAYSLKSGGKKQKTFWHNLYAWGPTANYIAKSGKKGAQLAITGKLVTQKYTSKEGQSRLFTAIEVKKAIVL
jgi:single-strand DNA-binding protein